MREHLPNFFIRTIDLVSKILKTLRNTMIYCILEIEQCHENVNQIIM